MATGIRSLLDTVGEALPQVGNLGLLFFLKFFIFAALGVELFGRIECSEEHPCDGLGEHAHFHTFGMAFLTLFRIATGDNWNGIMKDTLREDCDNDNDCEFNCCVSPIIAPLFFVVFVLLSQFVLVNVVVAVLMKHLEESNTKMADAPSEAGKDTPKTDTDAGYKTDAESEMERGPPPQKDLASNPSAMSVPPPSPTRLDVAHPSLEKQTSLPHTIPLLKSENLCEPKRQLSCSAEDESCGRRGRFARQNALNPNTPLPSPPPNYEDCVNRSRPLTYSVSLNATRRPSGSIERAQPLAFYPTILSLQDVRAEGPPLLGVPVCLATVSPVPSPTPRTPSRSSTSSRPRLPSGSELPPLDETDGGPLEPGPPQPSSHHRRRNHSSDVSGSSFDEDSGQPTKPLLSLPPPGPHKIP